MLHHCLKPLFWVCKDQLWLDEQKSYFKVNLQSAEDFKSSKILIVPHVTTAKREKKSFILAVISNDLTILCSESFAWIVWKCLCFECTFEINFKLLFQNWELLV